MIYYTIMKFKSKDFCSSKKKSDPEGNCKTIITENEMNNKSLNFNGENDE